jgi:putative membrane protein (TIGR04086 family)
MRLKVWPIAAGVLTDLVGTVCLAVVFLIAHLAAYGGDPESLEMFDGPQPLWRLMAMLVGGLAFVALGGFVAGRLARERTLEHGIAVGVGCLLVGMGLQVVFPDPTEPMWYSLLALGVMVPAGAFGGYLSRRRVDGQSTEGTVDRSVPLEVEDGADRGMKTAGRILLTTAGIGVVAWLVEQRGLPFSSGIDLFLGIKMLQRAHSWRSWVMVRSWVGVAGALFAGAMIAFGDLSAWSGPLAVSLGALAYSVSLLLLLSGMPTQRRVQVGRLTFAGAVILMLAGIVLLALDSPAEQLP